MTSIFDELELIGISVPQALRLYQSFATFDFESVPETVIRENGEQLDLSDDLFVFFSKKLRFTNQYIPVSVAIHHNNLLS